jgi:tRNA (uracil-5-)-methyltransferase TRM9
MEIPEIEKKYVEDTYDKISLKWNTTRHSVWRYVNEYLTEKVDKDSKILEIGCGNGKNMLLRDDVNFYGCDISKAQIEMCKSKGLKNVIVCDMCNLDYKNDEFDNIICIATFHHLSNNDRRHKALKEMIRVVKTKGTILISLWSFEPFDSLEKRKFETQDEYVTFLTPLKDNLKIFTISERYYHLYKKDEFDKFIKNYTDIIIIDKIEEKNNYFYVLQKL